MRNAEGKWRVKSGGWSVPIKIEWWTRLLFLAVLGMGCQHTVLDPEKLAWITIAWNDLTQEEKATVVGDWRRAEVRDEPPAFFQGRQVVSVTFRTTQDELLGPIIVYIDRETRQVIGRGLRD